MAMLRRGVTALLVPLLLLSPLASATIIHMAGKGVIAEADSDIEFVDMYMNDTLTYIITDVTLSQTRARSLCTVQVYSSGRCLFDLSLWREGPRRHRFRPAAVMETKLKAFSSREEYTTLSWHLNDSQYSDEDGTGMSLFEVLSRHSDQTHFYVGLTVARRRTCRVQGVTAAVGRAEGEEPRSMGHLAHGAAKKLLRRNHIQLEEVAMVPRLLLGYECAQEITELTPVDNTTMPKLAGSPPASNAEPTEPHIATAEVDTHYGDEIDLIVPITPAGATPDFGEDRMATIDPINTEEPFHHPRTTKIRKTSGQSNRNTALTVTRLETATYGRLVTFTREKGVIKDNNLMPTPPASGRNKGAGTRTNDQHFTDVHSTSVAQPLLPTHLNPSESDAQPPTLATDVTDVVSVTQPASSTNDIQYTTVSLSGDDDLSATATSTSVIPDFNQPGRKEKRKNASRTGRNNNGNAGTALPVTSVIATDSSSSREHLPTENDPFNLIEEHSSTSSGTISYILAGTTLLIGLLIGAIITFVCVYRHSHKGKGEVPSVPDKEVAPADVQAEFRYAEVFKMLVANSEFRMNPKITCSAAALGYADRDAAPADADADVRRDAMKTAVPDDCTDHYPGMTRRHSVLITLPGNTCGVYDTGLDLLAAFPAGGGHIDLSVMADDEDDDHQAASQLQEAANTVLDDLGHLATPGLSPPPSPHSAGN